MALSANAVVEGAAADTVIGTLQGIVDPDAGDTHTFSLIGDAGGRFKLVGDSLQVFDGTLLDFEAASSHAVTVRVTDAGALSYDKVLTIDVTDANEAPTDVTLSANSVAEGAATDTIVGTLLGIVDQDAGDSHTLGLVDDAGGRFKLVGNTLQVADGTLLDFEGATSHAVTVRVTDAGGLFHDKAFTIDVTDVNDAPSDVALSANTVAEGAATDTVIGTLMGVVDQDAGDTHSLSLMDGAGGRFKLVGAELQVADGSLLDLESASSHAVTVRVTDAGGLVLDKTFSIDLTNVNEAPTDVALSANAVVEGAAADTVIGTLQGIVDPDAGDTHAFSLIDDAGGRFKLVGDSLQVFDGTLLDFETASSHAVTVRVTDAGALSYDEVLTIDVTDANEAPTDVTLSANSVAEGAATDTIVGTLLGVVDQDAGDSHTLGLVDDAGGRFKLVGNTLQVADGTLLDFEGATSHAVTVRVTDAGGLSYDKAFTINLTDVNEAPTDVTLSASTVAEDAAADTVIGTFQGIVDPDAGDTHTFSLVNDAGGRFKLVGNALQVTDGALLDFETAASHTGVVQVTDAGGLSIFRAFTIDVTNVNEAPTDVALSANAVVEGAAADTVIGTLQGIVDPDAGDTHMLSLIDDAGGRFKLVGDSLQVLDGTLLDFEDASSHAVTVRVTDAGALSYDEVLTIDVTDVNEAPTGVALSASTVVEGAAADTVVGTLQGVVDPDAGDVHSFILLDDAAGRFKLVGAALQVADGSLLDFESAASHTVTVRVTDTAGLSYDETLAINVSDVNEAPTDLALSASTVAEGAAADTVIGILQGVVDPDAGDTHSLSLMDNAGGRFKLVGNAIQVADGALLDFESATSHTITVRVTDAAGLSNDKTFAIDVTDINEAPTDVALSANIVAEGAATDTVVGTLQGIIDPDAGDTHTLLLVDSAGGRFKLLGAELQVADGTLLDFEGASSHSVTVRVTDAGGLSYDKALTINVADVNEAPTDMALSANAVAEGAAANTIVGTFQGVLDPDAGDIHTLMLIDDAGGRFQLIGAELRVADGTLLDFEAATSHVVTVRVTDAAGLSTDKSFAIDVTDVNEAPTDVNLSASTVVEGAAAGTIIGTLQTVVDPDAGDTHTFSLIDDATGRFQLVGAELRVADGTLLDFESATSHTVTVRATDAAGLSYDKTFTIDIADVNETPLGVALSANTVTEGAATGTAVGTLQGVVDPDAGDSHSFSLVDDAGGRFKLVGDELQVADGTLIDFEGATNHSVTTRVTDAGGLSYDKTFTIDVADVNEAPTSVALSANSVIEGSATGTVVGALQDVVDQDVFDSHTYSLMDNAGGRFMLVGSELQVADGTLLDFGAATTHAVLVRVTDAGGLFSYKAFTIDVTDLEEVPTDVALSASTVTEGAAAGTVVGTLQDVVDPNLVDIHTFSLVDNASGRFQLVGAELQLVDGALLDFETTASHDITVRVTDAAGLTLDKIFTIDVTDANEAPTNVALSASSVAEDAASGTVIGTLQGVVDADSGDSHTFSLVDGARMWEPDAQDPSWLTPSFVSADGRFKLLGNELQVADGALLDFANATSHTVDVRVTDAAGLTYDETLTIDVTNVNEAPTDVTLSVSTVAEGAPADTIVGTLQGTVDPDPGDSHTFNLIDDAGGRFQLVGNALQVVDGTQLDFESAASHTVTVRVTDAAGLSLDKTFTIDVTDVNEVPTGVALSATTVVEGAVAGMAIGTLHSVVDPDAADTHTFSLVDDAGGRFQLVGDALQVANGTLLDFEAASDHAITVRVTDAAGLFYDEAFTIDVTDANEAPADVTLSTNTVSEGAALGTVVGTVQGVVDPDAGDTHTLSLVDDAAGRFQLVGSALQVADGTLLDFETAASHTVAVRVTDAAGLALDKVFTIDVADVNEVPTGVALSAATVTEGAANDTVIGTLQGVVDPDAGDAHTFTLMDDAGGRFKLVGNAIQVADGALLDFEAAASHAVTVRVTDTAGLAYDETLTIDVTDVNETPSDVTLSASPVVEGAATGTVVGSFQALVDPDAGDTHTYTLLDNAGGRFQLVGTELQVANGALLDFEAATSHAAAVQITDAGGLSLFRAFTINVADMNEAPTDLALSASSLAEGAVTDTVVGTLQGVVDPDAGDSHTFSLIDDAGGRFKLVGDSLQVFDGTLLDFETATSHIVTVRVTDAAGLSVDKAVTIDVTNVNEAPTDFALTANTVAEAAGAGTVIGMLQNVVDPDAGDTHALSLVDDAGGRFKIVGTELQVADGVLLDFETATSHPVTVRVTDAAGLSHDKSFTIAVTGVNEAPTDVALSANSVVEGAANDTVVGMLQGVVDPDAGDSNTLSLVDDAGGRFKLVGADLQVADGTLLDFEGATSHAVTVRVTDAAGLFLDKVLSIDVADVNEAPTDVTLSANTVVEGAATDTAVGILQNVTDPDAGDTHLLSLVDDAGGRLKLVGTSLQVADGTLLDFEASISHAVTVRVIDAAGLVVDKTITIDVTDVNEAPTDIALSASTVVEGSILGTIIGTLQGVIDPDAGDTHTFSLVDDAGGRFQLVGNALQVMDGTLLDFDIASDHAVTVRVTDAAGLSYDATFTIGVTDVNEAPTDVTLSANSVAEGALTDTVVGMLGSVADPNAGDTHTFSLLDDAGGRFKVVGSELQVVDGSLLDFESAASHAVTVRVTDAGGLSLDKVLTVDVTDVNEAPADVSLSASTVVEGAAIGTVVGTLQGVVDPDAGDTHTLSLVDDAGGRFQLVGAELRVANGALLDFETAASHAVTVRATDAAGLALDKTFTIDVNDANEAPTGVALSASTVVEGAAPGTAIGTLQNVVDPDVGDTHTFSLLDDAGGRFQLVGTELQVANGALLDFATATSHTIVVQVTDAGGLAHFAGLTIAVADLNEAPTDVALSANSVAEGTANDTVLGSLQNVVDPNVGDTHTFSLVDDAGGRFKLVGSDLQVADGTQLDFETAASHGVTVRVTDAGGLTFDKAFTLDITDVDEAPTDLTLSANTVAEGVATNTAVGTLQDVVAPDAGDNHTYSLVDDAGGRFKLVGNALQVADGVLLDFESAASHMVTARVTDAGGQFVDKAFTIDVTNVNEAPTAFLSQDSRAASGTLQEVVRAERRR